VYYCNMEFREASERIPELLSQHLQLEVQQVLISEQTEVGTENHTMPDLTVVLNGYEFAIEYQYRSRSEQVGQAIRQIQSWRSRLSNTIPLLVVPYMGGVGRKLCEDAKIPWMDLSGNAWIHWGRIRITILGRENQFKNRGRPANLFAPKSARIIRVLLVNYDDSYRQSELAELSGVDPGHVSRVVNRLEETGFISRDSDRSVLVKNPDLLLDAWVDEYDFEDHDIVRGHLSVRSPEENLERLDDIFAESNVEYALTGLPAAWLYVRHSGYRLVTVYVSSMPDDLIPENVGWRVQERGGNVWMIRPRDIGVFYGSVDRGGYRCVSAVQTYLDLQSLPERSGEAADALRKEVLNWSGLSRNV